MADSIFLKLEFIAWIAFSMVLPAGIYSFMLMRWNLSRKMVLFFGALLIGLAGGSVILLQALAAYARVSPDLLDDRIFLSELSVALYLLPAVFAGIGTNLVSHVLIRHLGDAERRYDIHHETIQ